MEHEQDHIGNYHGKLFVGMDALKGDFKSNPMLRGTNEEGVKLATAEIEDSIRRGLLPSSYDVHNSLSLLPSGLIDTTDLSVVINAYDHHFDHDGYLRGFPLQKDIFFTNPYLTCGECNHVAFLDAATLRNGLLFRQASLAPTKTDLILRSASTVTDDEQERAEIDGKKMAPVKIVSENFPACQVCGRTDEYRIGLHDLSAEIAERKRRERERLRRVHRAATTVQLAYRRYCRKMYSQARWKRGLVRRLLHYKAATRIISFARGRLARRRFECEKWLKVIKTAIPSLLRWALQPTPSHLKCFWYTRPKELELVFSNYWKLLERTGFNPPRLIVERNICELGRRILERQSYLITVIQRRWRGFVARRFVTFYRLEIMRLLQTTVARALKIQRLYRAHVVRCILIPKMRKEQRNHLIMSKYRKERADLKEQKRRQDQSTSLIAHYAHERELEKTARYTSRIDQLKFYDNRKMRAWAQSVYFAGKAGGDRLTMLVDGVLADAQAEGKATRDRLQWERDRKAYIKDKVRDTGPTGYGLRGLNYQPVAAEGEGGHHSMAEEMGYDQVTQALLAEQLARSSDGRGALHVDYQPGGKHRVLRGDPKKSRDPEYFPQVKKPKRKPKTAPTAAAATTGGNGTATEESTATAAASSTDPITPTATGDGSGALALTATGPTGTGEAATGADGDTGLVTQRSSTTADADADANNRPLKPPRDIAAIFDAHSSRSRSMGRIFEAEVDAITRATIDRVSHDFRKKKGPLELLARLRDHNIRREVLFTDELKKLKYEGTGGPGKGVSKAFSLGLARLPTAADNRVTVGAQTAAAAVGSGSASSPVTALVPISSDIISAGTADAAAAMPVAARKFRTGDPKADRKTKKVQIVGGGGDEGAAGTAIGAGKKKSGGVSRLAMKPGGYKYPANVNDNPIDWLYDDNMAEYSNAKTYH